MVEVVMVGFVGGISAHDLLDLPSKTDEFMIDVWSDSQKDCLDLWCELIFDTGCRLSILLAQVNLTLLIIIFG